MITMFIMYNFFCLEGMQIIALLIETDAPGCFPKT